MAVGVPDGADTGDSPVSKPSGRNALALSASQANRLTQSGAGLPVSRSHKSLAKWLQFLIYRSVVIKLVGSVMIQ